MITPDSGYEIKNVLVDGVSKGKITSYTFENVTENHTIQAEFRRSLIPEGPDNGNNNGTTLIAGSNVGTTLPGVSSVQTPTATASGSTQVKTGDDNQIFLYLLVLIAAAGVAAGAYGRLNAGRRMK